jgi:hypothetical protein
MEVQENNMSDNDYDWMSVSEYAKLQKRSKQTIYNWCKAGIVVFKTFKRGSMNGILLRIPKNKC